VKFHTVVERCNIKTILFNMTSSEKIDQVVGMRYWYIILYYVYAAHSANTRRIRGCGAVKRGDMTLSTNQFRRVQIFAFLFSEAYSVVNKKRKCVQIIL